VVPQPDRLAASARSTRRAPAPLDLVQDLLNTRSLMRGFDRLADLEQARAWLDGSGPARAAGLSSADLIEVDLGPLRALREVLRDARCSSAGGGGSDETPGPALDALAVDAPAVVGLDARGVPVVRPHPEAPPVRAAVLCALLGAGDSWARLKVCANPGCRWAFYDTSRNHSGTWCDMNICGARAKMARYRHGTG
jgi:predicted RNA-binding Zn ribbon-like protein